MKLALLALAVHVLVGTTAHKAHAEWDGNVGSASLVDVEKHDESGFLRAHWLLQGGGNDNTNTANTNGGNGSRLAPEASLDALQTTLNKEAAHVTRGHSTRQLQVDPAVEKESVNWPSACMLGYKSSGFELLNTEKFDVWFNETSVLHLAETGVYTGPDDIAEYVEFLRGPFFSYYEPSSLFQTLPISFSQNECVVLMAGNNKAITDVSLAKPGCIETAIGVKMAWSVSDQDGSDFLMHRVDVFYSAPFVQHLFGYLLDSDASRNYICGSVLASKCEKTFALNNLTVESCKALYDALPGTDEDGTGSVKGNSKGCRILHSAFAATNAKHCPHLSFVPEKDYLGREKCQRSDGIKPEDLFSDVELKFIHDVGKENGLPGITLLAECESKNSVQSKLQPSYLRQLQSIFITWITVTLITTIAMFIPQIRHNWRLAIVVQFLICLPFFALFWNDCNSPFLKIGALVTMNLDPRCDISSLARGWERWKLKYSPCGRLLRLGCSYSIRLLHHTCGALLLLNAIDYCKIEFGLLASLADLDMRFQVIMGIEIVDITLFSGVALRSRGYRSYGRLVMLGVFIQGIMALWLVAEEWENLPQLYYVGVATANTTDVVLTVLNIPWFDPSTHEFVRDGGSVVSTTSSRTLSSAPRTSRTSKFRGSVARLSAKKLQASQHTNIDVEAPRTGRTSTRASTLSDDSSGDRLDTLDETSEEA